MTAETKHIHSLLNSTISALKGVMPFEAEFQPPSLLQQPYEQQEMGVLIGVIGDLKGRIVLDASSAVFCKISSAMFGMELEGEMLESFTGELGNMVAGNLCMDAAAKAITIDITPPTVMVGKTKLYGFHYAFALKAELEGAGTVNILLALDEK